MEAECRGIKKMRSGSSSNNEERSGEVTLSSHQLGDKVTFWLTLVTAGANTQLGSKTRSGPYTKWILTCDNAVSSHHSAHLDQLRILHTCT